MPASEWSRATADVRRQLDAATLQPIANDADRNAFLAGAD
jgi:hypothetical protein